MEYSQEYLTHLLEELNEIGVALSAEKDHDRLLEYIITTSMRITAADGGTLYLRSEEDTLDFAILYNRSLKEHKGGTSSESIDLYPVRLFDDEGNPNTHMVSAAAALSKQTVNIPDAYTSEDYDFSGTRDIDRKKGYRSVSFLTVPMTDHEQEVIGVLQLINAVDKETGKPAPFSMVQQKLVESLASQAAVSITNQSLIAAQKNMFDAFIKLIASAIDEKSPYTAGHCRRVPVIARLLADASMRIDRGPLRDFTMTEEEKYELDVAAWLHDCGKITTPEYVVDKGTKLETIFDRIRWVEDRFEWLKQNLVVDALLKRTNGIKDLAELLVEDAELREALGKVEQDMGHVRKCNTGGEVMSESHSDRLRAIAKRTLRTVDAKQRPVLSEEELENLLIGRGTLTPREREIINNHVVVTIKMLESLPYPKHLQRVPEYAGGHHERMDGAGYPKRLKGATMSLPARMLAIADVFEALTAGDRPYKKAMSLPEALCILRHMKDSGHIDPDLYDVFIHEKVYLKYAEEYLPEAQRGELDEQALLASTSLDPGTGARPQGEDPDRP